MSNSFEIPWTVICQALLSTEFSNQEFWTGLPFPSPGELSNRNGTHVSCIAKQILYHWATMEAETTDYPHTKKLLRHLLYTVYKINFKWIIYLDIRANIIRPLKANVGENLHDLGLDKVFRHYAKILKLKEKLINLTSSK